MATVVGGPSITNIIPKPGVKEWKVYATGAY